MFKAPSKTDRRSTLTDTGIVSTSKLSRLAVANVFERIGGEDRLEEVANEDPKWFFEKMYRNLMQPERGEDSKEKTVAELLAELDSQIINVTPTKITTKE